MPASQVLCQTAGLQSVKNTKPERALEESRADLVQFLSVVERSRATVNNLRIRYMTFNDVYKNTRRDWLEELVDCYDCHVYSDSSTFHLSLAGSDFDVFLVGGIDAMRMAKVCRSGDAILRGRIKVALVSESSPRQRARLLSAGFDDVFDVERLHPDEAVTRLHAIWSRYEMRRSADQAMRHEDALLDRICHAAEINKRERILLLTLLKSESQFATYFALQSAVSDYHEVVSFGSLKVSVTHLRKKMKEGVRIISRSGAGYQLISRW